MDPRLSSVDQDLRSCGTVHRVHPPKLVATVSVFLTVGFFLKALDRGGNLRACPTSTVCA